MNNSRHFVSCVLGRSRPGLMVFSQVSKGNDLSVLEGDESDAEWA